MKKNKRMLRNAVALLLCLAQLMPVFAFAETGGEVRTYTVSEAADKTQSDTLHALAYDLYEYGTEDTLKLRSSAMTLAEYAAVGDKTSVDNSVSIGDGQMYVRKDAYFESDADAQQAIVKIEIDTIIDYANTAPIDVMFILDHSGSMNMWTNRDTSRANDSRLEYYTWDAEQSKYVKNTQAGSLNPDPWSVPCMNPEHYYNVPLLYTDGEGNEHKAHVSVSPAALEEDETLGGYFSIIDNLRWWTSFEKQVITDKNVKPEQLGVMLEDGTALTEAYITKHGGELTMPGGWKTFTAVHYDRSGREISMADALAEYFGKVSSQLDSGEFYFSPLDNDEYGCYDRAVVAEQSIKAFTETILNANDENRVGFVSFDVDAEGFALTRDKDKLAQIWENRSGALQTDYRDGLNKALELLKGETDQTRDTYVIFISDGMPSLESTDPAFPTTEAESIVSSMKALSPELSGDAENYRFYSVGIQAQEAKDYLSAIADEDKMYLCNSISQFKAAMSSIQNSILNTQVSIEDVIGMHSGDMPASYELYVDASHPVTTQSGIGADSEIKTYADTSSAEFAADGLKVDESTPSISWSFTAHTNSYRLAFYIQLKEALRTTGVSKDGSYPTNAVSANASYEVFKDGISQNQNSGGIPVPAELRVKTASLTIEKNHSTAAKDEVGQVGEDEEIIYTFNADYTGDGTVVFENVTLTDEVPEGMTYVSGDLTKNVGTIGADRAGIMSFTAKVSEEAKPNTEIPNAATFSVADAPQAVADTNEVRDFYYKAAAVTLPVKATKELHGRELMADEFSFTLTATQAPEGVELPAAVTVKNDAQGVIDFGTLTFEKAGEYVYQMKEEAGDAAGGITYSEQEYTLTVTVTDDQKGQLVAEPVYTIDASAAESVVFSNTYNASAVTLPVKATKELRGRELEAGEFTFRMTATKVPEGVDLPQAVTVKNDAEGAIDFGTLAFEKVGEYVFVLEEGIPVDENGNQIENGITYSTQQYTLTVTVTDDQKGQLVAEPVYTIGGSAAENVVFNNTYGASVDLVLTGTKEIAGREFKSGDRFTFAITGSDGAPMPADSTVTIAPTSGTTEELAFKPITFTEQDAGKTYVYTVVEVPENLPGIEMDPAVMALTVKVTDNGDGTLKLDASLQKDGEDVQGMVFRNVYHADGSVPLVLVKNMKNREFWLGDTFTFVLTPKDGAPLPMKDNETVSTVTIMPKSGTSANVDFGEFRFTEADAGKVYTYEVAEQAGTDRRIIYDTAAKTFSISVSDDGNGNVLAAPAYPEGGLTFTNEYIPPISITVNKVWNRPYGAIGMPEISFTLTREGDPDFSVTRKLNAGNNWETTIEDLDSDYVYMVEEVNAPAGYTSTITQDGLSFTITNTELPSTGDDSRLLLWCVLACVSMAGLALFVRRRRTE